MANWQFRSLNPNETSGASIADDNFADEERTSVEILVRETIQNPLDARLNDTVVRVEYKLVTVDMQTSNFAKSIFCNNWARHFLAGDLIQENQPPTSMTFLVIEDFGTTGLEGCYTDSSIEGSTENWNAFWFREGEGAKTTKSNGGAGQGKITLYLASQLRSVFALTKRKSDSNELLFGCCRFNRNYKLPNDTNRWAKEARWGAVSNPNQLATPILNSPIINAMKTELKLTRGSKFGTTFIVPMPASGITEASLCNAVINEFFFAINRGSLVVKIGNITLDSSTIASQANDMKPPSRMSKHFRDFLAITAKKVSDTATATMIVPWGKEKKLDSNAFKESELTSLKNQFQNSKLVSADLLILIKSRQLPNTSTSKFRVLLQKDESADQSQELYVRQDLGIDGEKRLKTTRTITPVMALTFIEDPNLSNLLVAAEEPTHRKWNSRRPKVLAQYISPGDVLNLVRNAALRLVQLISPEEKKDETALAIYFADPNSEPTKRIRGKGITPDASIIKEGFPKQIPKARLKPILLKNLERGFEIRSKATDGISFPIDCKITLAYATAVGDAFKLWDAADFWIEDEVAHPRLHSGVSAQTTALNTFSFRLNNENSWLSVSGFDQKRQLEIRVNFQEVTDGSND